MSNEETELWIQDWLDNIVKNMERKGYTKEQIIEELSKYGNVKRIEKGGINYE